MRHSIQQSPIEKAILFVLTYKAVPRYARNSIVEFIVYPKARILAVRCSISEHLFHNRWQIAKATGWYPYITGIPLQTSPISAHVDEITTRNHVKTLQLDGTNLTPVELIPVHLNPNHVSFLLQMGGLNVLLDALVNVIPRIQKERKTLWCHFVEALEIKPSAFGVSINLKKLLGITKKK